MKAPLRAENVRGYRGPQPITDVHHSVKDQLRLKRGARSYSALRIKFTREPAGEALLPRRELRGGGKKSKIPVELNPVIRALENSMRILDLKDDWDGDGSCGYSRVTWERMRQFLLDNSRQLWLITGKPTPAPSISPAQEGSIDILWRAQGRMLLVNVPADLEQPASYYGESGQGDTVNGNVPTAGDNHWLLLWLTR